MRKSAIVAVLLAAASAWAAEPMKALIVDGQNNHKWQETTPVLKRLLEETGLFKVDVATSPAKGQDLSNFKPDFAAYKVVISNYNGEPWAPATMEAFEKYVRNGGGFVSYHAADNSFPQWKAYNEMIAVGGWGNQQGPMIKFRDGKMAKEDPAGVKAGHHGTRHPFLVIDRNSTHPITLGLPKEWMHNIDELYDSLRGPAENVNVLATAFSSKEMKGTGDDEPMLMVIPYGKGRVFHTTLGHDLEAMKCVGFIVTFQRGAEWAATGKVKQKVPKDFPTADKVSLR